MNNKEQLELAKRYKGSRCVAARQYCNLSSDASWCDAFVTYIFYKAGNKDLYCNGKKETYCPHSIEWCKTHLAQIPLYLAMPSDIIFFDWQPNNVPDHIGFVTSRDSTSAIDTIEGNTSGGIVDTKKRPAKYVLGVFRPHFTGNTDTSEPLTIDGKFGYKSISMLQKALGIKVDSILGKHTVRKLQEVCGANPDGCWAKKTSVKCQQMIGAKPDGDFGEKSVMKLQEWCNEMVFGKSEKPVDPPKKKKTNAEKIVEKATAYAWKRSTPRKTYKYSTGHARQTYKEALKKYMHKTAKISQSDCGYFVSVLVRATGIDKDFDCLKGFEWDYSKHLKVVHKGGKIRKGELQPGDIIRYKKKNGQHTLIYYGKGKIAEAQRGHAFPKIKKDRKKYNRSNVKKSTIQILRAKE